MQARSFIKKTHGILQNLKNFGEKFNKPVVGHYTSLPKKWSIKKVELLMLLKLIMSRILLPA